MESKQEQNSEKSVDVKSKEGQERYLEFSVGDECFAIPLLSVREVISVPETTPIPKAPAHFVGIMNLRGQVISVVDLRTKLKISPTKDNLEEAVIIAKIGQVNVGVIVDAINRVHAFSADSISSVPEIQTQVNAEYILGVHRKELSLTIILDLPRVLDIQDLAFIDNHIEAA